MHPNLHDLHELTDPQIEERLVTLNRYYFITDNPDVRQQMILVMDTLKVELEERRLAAKRKQQEESDENGLDGLINVS